MQEGELSELIEPKPTNSYSIAKDTLRKKIAHLQLQDNINFKWVRLFYMYGSGQSPNSLLSQLDRSLSMNEPIFNMSGGEQERDYLPVEEVAANIINIALQQTVTGIINCCSGNPIKVKDFVINYLQTKNKYIQLNLGYYPYVDYEPMSFWGNNKKLKTILNNE
jgi:dTDP-6-deoxy-L-talose 4-dehydrogenase (NAD+)